MIRSTVKAGVSRLRRIASRVRDRALAPVSRPAPPAAPAPHVAGTSPKVEPPSEDAVRQVLEEMVRPALQGDGGDIELVGVTGGEVRVRLQGACHGCAGAGMTLQLGVEALLKEELPGITRVVAVP